MKKWFRQLVQKGKKFNLFIFLFFIVFSGIGYLFLNQFHDVRYFNKKIDFNQRVIDTFYKGDTGQYLIQAGKESEAVKHGIEVSPNYIQNYIKEMPQFLNAGKFDIKLYETFLKANKITQYDVWRYASQQFTINILNNMLTELPVKSSDTLSKWVTTPTTLESISGYQYFLKDEIIENKVAEQMSKVQKKDLKKFIADNTAESSLFYINPEKRKGLLIKLSKTKMSDVKREQLSEILKSKINKQNATQKLSEIFGPQTNIVIIEKDFIIRSGDISDLLFEPFNFYEKGNSIYIPLVEEIVPITAKELTDEDLEKIKEEYELMIFKQTALVESLKLSNMVNQGLLKESELDKICYKKPFSKNLSSLMQSELGLCILKKGHSAVFENYESRIVIFVCKNKTYGANSNATGQMRTLLDLVTSHIEGSVIDCILAYWIHDFEYKS
jgi:hypothetical protein